MPHREAYNKSAPWRDNVKVLEEVMLATHAGAKAIGEKVLQNSVVNTEAAFDAAQAIARAKTFPEAARLQANFVQQQLAVASSQTRALRALHEGCQADVRDAQRRRDEELRPG